MYEAAIGTTPSRPALKPAPRGLQMWGSRNGQTNGMQRDATEGDRSWGLVPH